MTCSLSIDGDVRHWSSANVVQSVERHLGKMEVAGSIPAVSLKECSLCFPNTS
jgi:hypothetical protein